MERTITSNLSAKKAIGKSGKHPVLSGRSGSRYKSLGFDSEREALVNGLVDSGGPYALKEERDTTRSNLSLKPEAGYHHVQIEVNRQRYGDRVTPGAPPEETARILEREASHDRARVQPMSRRRKTWYKPWTWLKAGKKSNTKKRKTRKNKTRKHKTRKYKTRKNKTRKQKRK